MLPPFVPLVRCLRIAAHFEMLQLLSLRPLVLVLQVTGQTHRTELLRCSGAGLLLRVRLVCFLLFALRYSTYLNRLLLILEQLIKL